MWLRVYSDTWHNQTIASCVGECRGLFRIQATRQALIPPEHPTLQIVALADTNTNSDDGPK